MERKDAEDTQIDRLLTTKTNALRPSAPTVNGSSR
jgi:hypothetical protein